MQYVTSITDTSLTGVTNRLVAPRARLVAAGLALVAAVLAGCSGGSGAPVEVVPGAGNGPAAQTYTGPAPSTADVQAFKINLWDNIHADNRCGTCHSVSGGQTPMFARSDDVNLAYAAANLVVDLASPKDSMMVREGRRRPQLLARQQCGVRQHSDDVDHELGRLDRQRWRSQDPARAPGDPRSRHEQELPGRPGPAVFDDGVSDRFAVLLALPQLELIGEAAAVLRRRPWQQRDGRASRVRGGQAEDGSRRSREFAVRSALAQRVPQLLDGELHERRERACRTRSRNFAAGITPTQVDPNLVTSKASTLYEGTVASGGHRDDSTVIAHVRVQDGPDLRPVDHRRVRHGVRHERRRSGHGPDAVGQRAVVRRLGLEFRRRQGAGLHGCQREAEAPGHRLLASTRIEAWVTPGNVVQEDMRIVSYSAGLTLRNFNLGQTMYNYDFFNRSDKTDAQRQPAAVDVGRRRGAAGLAPARRRHVRSGDRSQDLRERRARRINDPAPGGSLNDWDDTFAFVLGNEVSGNRQWAGVIRLVAIHNRALTRQSRSSRTSRPASVRNTS